MPDAGPAGVGHALIKGPTTARWLYDPPRGYCDVDVLVDWSATRAAVAALRRIGLRPAYRWNEGAPHSRVLLTAAGWEVDLHRALHGLAPRDARAARRTWPLLAGHVEAFELNHQFVAALDPAGRCLVLALHAVGAAPGS